MLVKELKDRRGVTFTPLVHKDSVVDSNRIPLKFWIAPIGVNNTLQGNSTHTNFNNGAHIVVSTERVENSDGSFHNNITFNHDNTTTVEEAEETINVVGVYGLSGNKRVKTSSVTFNPKTNTFTVPKLNSNGDINLATGKVLKINDIEVLSPTEYVGNSASSTKLKNSRTINISDADSTNTGTGISFDGTENRVIKLPATIKASLTGNSTSSDKVNHTLTFSSGNTFNGSSDKTINQNDIDGVLNVSHGGTGLSTFSLNTLYMGNGSNSLTPLNNTAQYQVLALDSNPKPSYQTLTLNHIPTIGFTLCSNTSLSDVSDFAV